MDKLSSPLSSSSQRVESSLAPSSPPEPLVKECDSASIEKPLQTRVMDRVPSALENFPDAAQTFQFCVYLNVESIRLEWLLVGCSSVQKCKERMDPLLTLGFLYWKTPQETLGIDPLQRQKIKQNQTDKEALLPRALELVENLNKKALLFFKVQRDANRAKDYWEQALQILKTFCGENHALVVACYENLSGAWSALEEKEEALLCHGKALAAYRDLYGENKYVVATLKNLGEAWNHLEEKGKAIYYFKQAVKSAKLVHGENAGEVGENLHQLGFIYDELGRYDRALVYFKQALAVLVAAHGENHPLVIGAFNNVGLSWSDLGEYRKSLQYFDQALKSSISLYGENHSSVAVALSNLGNAYQDLGKYRKAIEHYERVLQIRRAVCGERHASVATTLNNLGMVLLKVDRPIEALHNAKMAYDIFKEELGEDALRVRRVNNLVEKAERGIVEMRESDKIVRMLRGLIGGIVGIYVCFFTLLFFPQKD